MSEPEAKAGRGVEVEVGGSGLLAVSLVVLVLCAASFWLGRWSVQAVGVRDSPGEAPTSSVEDGGDLAEDLTFFDRLEQAPELSAQGNERTATPPEPTPVPRAETTSPPGDGEYSIQVLASAERSAAEAVMARLLRRDYPARLVVGEKDGREIYRVRVVGYADEASAEAAARTIQQQEGLRTWVTR